MVEKTIACPYCGKRFADEMGRWTHTRAKHPGKKNPYPQTMRDNMKTKAANQPPQDDDDESFADRAIAAQIAINCGKPTDDGWLLP